MYTRCIAIASWVTWWVSGVSDDRCGRGQLLFLHRYFSLNKICTVCIDERPVNYYFCINNFLSKNVQFVLPWLVSGCLLIRNSFQPIWDFAIVQGIFLMHSDCCVLINLCTVYIDVGGDCEWSANSYLFFSMKCTVFNFALMRGQRTPICLPHQSFPQ